MQAQGNVAPSVSADVGKKRAIIVLGMHRSGTSALTRTISLLGAGLPATLMQAGEGNERGHWEPDRIVALHERMLAEAGSRWDDWRAFDFSELKPERGEFYRSEIKSLLNEEFRDSSLFILKDPRICRFAPLYRDILAELGFDVCYVIPVRNPLAVIASLAKRDGMTGKFAALLWLRHVLDAEYVTRGELRCFSSYDELLADWRPVIETIGREMALDWPIAIDAASDAISSHLSPDLQHHVYDLADLSNESTCDVWLNETYQCLLHLVRETDPNILIRLDAVRRAFNRYAVETGEIVFPELQQREHRLFGEIHTLRQQADAERQKAAQAAQLAEAERARADAESHAAQSAREHAAAEAGRATMERARADAADHAAFAAREAHAEAERRLIEAGERQKDIAAQLDQTRDSLATVETALRAAEAQKELLLNSNSWRITAPLRAIRRPFVRRP